MRTPLLVLAIPAALLAAAPATADLYKWVDERGVTNYSNEPPADPGTARKLARVENKVSVYTPDEGLLAATRALRERIIKSLSEPAPEPQGPQVARIPAQPVSSYDQCVASGWPGCDALYNTYYPAYWPTAVLYPGRALRPTRFLTPKPLPVSGSNAMMSRTVPRAGMPLR